MSVLEREQQVLDLAGAGVAVLWRRDDWFVSTTVYRCFGEGGWLLCEPEGGDNHGHRYPNDALWAIATQRPQTSTVSIADGTRQVESVAELEMLPRDTLVQVEQDVLQNLGGEWWPIQPVPTADDEILRTKQLWDWYGAAGITVIWHPEETGWAP